MLVLGVCFVSRQLTVTLKQCDPFALLFQGNVCEIPHFNDIQ